MGPRLNDPLSYIQILIKLVRDSLRRGVFMKPEMSEVVIGRVVGTVGNCKRSNEYKSQITHIKISSNKTQKILVITQTHRVVYGQPEN